MKKHKIFVLIYLCAFLVSCDFKVGKLASQKKYKVQEVEFIFPIETSSHSNGSFDLHYSSKNLKVDFEFFKLKVNGVDLGVLNPKDKVSFLTPGQVLINGVARTAANIPKPEALSSKLQTNIGLDNYLNSIKDNYNDKKFDNLYAMHAPFVKTKLNSKDNKKGMALIQKLFGKIQNCSFSHYQVEKYKEFKIFVLYYQIKASKLNSYLIVRLTENEDGTIGLWGLHFEKYP